MKKLWVFGTSHSAGACNGEYIKNCYSKLIHDKTEYTVKNLSKSGISFESQIKYIYYFLEYLQEKPDSILIELRGLPSKSLGYMPNRVLNSVYSYLKMIIKRFEDDINNNEYANIQPLFGVMKTREESFFKGIEIGDKRTEEWPATFANNEEMETYLNVYDRVIRLNYMFIEQRLLSLYGLLQTIKNLNITPYWFFIDPSCTFGELGISSFIKEPLNSMYVGYFKNNEWLSFLDHIKLDDNLLCECWHPNEKAHEIIANDLIPRLC